MYYFYLRCYLTYDPKMALYKRSHFHVLLFIYGMILHLRYHLIKDLTFRGLKESIAKSNQCNALYLQINLILCTRHTLFVPSHQYKYTTFILSTGFVLCSSSLRQLASNRLDGRHMGCLFFHILNDRRICRIYGHRQKNVFVMLICIAIWEERKITGNATSFAIQIFVGKNCSLKNNKTKLHFKK